LETISIQKIKWIKSLHLKKNREKENLFLVEGEKIVNELIQNFPDLIRLIVCKNSFIEKSEELKTIGLELIFQANTEEMERISTLNTASTVLAIVEKFNIICDTLYEKFYKFSIKLENILLKCLF
jgi:TrmH family RNA methyltransferase